MRALLEKIADKLGAIAAEGESYHLDKWLLARHDRVAKLIPAAIALQEAERRADLSDLAVVERAEALDRLITDRIGA